MLSLVMLIAFFGIIAELIGLLTQQIPKGKGITLKHNYGGKYGKAEIAFKRVRRR